MIKKFCVTFYTLPVPVTVVSMGMRCYYIATWKMDFTLVQYVTMTLGSAGLNINECGVNKTAQHKALADLEGVPSHPRSQYKFFYVRAIFSNNHAK